jgi:hypothetical protein
MFSISISSRRNTGSNAFIIHLISIHSSAMMIDATQSPLRQPILVPFNCWYYRVKSINVTPELSNVLLVDFKLYHNQCSKKKKKSLLN